MNSVATILFAFGMLSLSAVLVRGMMVSRRAVRWNAARTAKAVDRVLDGALQRLGDD